MDFGRMACRISGGTLQMQSPMTKRWTNHFMKLSYSNITVITFPTFMHRFPTYFIPGILDFNFPTREPPALIISDRACGFCWKDGARISIMAET